MTSTPLGRYLTQRSARMDRRALLRPMSPGEVLDVSMRLYRAQGWTILRLTAVPALLCVAGIAFALDHILPSFFLTSRPDDVYAQIWESALSLMAGFFLAGPIFLIGIAYSSGAVVSLVGDFMVGNVPNPEAAARTARLALRRLLLLLLHEMLAGWSGVLLGIGLLMLGAFADQVVNPNSIWPAIMSAVGYVGVCLGFLVLPLVLMRHALAPPIAVLEGKGSVACAKRSIELMKGHGGQPSGYSSLWMLWLILGFLFLVLVAGIGASLGIVRSEDFQVFVAQFPVIGAIAGKAIDLLPTFLVVWTLVPVWCTTVTILYFDRRIRLEGFDIEALARDVWRGNRTGRFEL